MKNVKRVLLTDLFDLSKNLNCVIDFNGNFQIVNTAFNKAVNTSKDSLSEKSFFDFLHPDDAAVTHRWIKESLVSPAIPDMENRLKNGGNTFYWIAWSSVLIPQQELILLSGRNIGPIKKREQHIIRFLNEYERIFDFSFNILCNSDQSGKIVQINKAVALILGYDRDEILHHDYAEFIHPDDKELSRIQAKKIIADNSHGIIENRYIHKNGGIVSMEWSVVWSEPDQVMFCIGRDVTENKKQEEASLLYEKRLTALVQSGSDLIAILSPEGVYSYVSPTVSQILGTSPEDYIGKTPFDFSHSDDTPILENALLQIADHDQVVLPPFRFKNAKGEWRWIQTTITNQLKNTAIKGIVANSSDITEIKENELRIIKQNEQLRAIAQINSHVIRKPVASILGLVQLIKDERIADRETLEVLNHLRAATEQLDAIIREVIDNTAD